MGGITGKSFSVIVANFAVDSSIFKTGMWSIWFCEGSANIYDQYYMVLYDRHFNVTTQSGCGLVLND